MHEAQESVSRARETAMLNLQSANKIRVRLEEENKRVANAAQLLQQRLREPLLATVERIKKRATD